MIDSCPRDQMVFLLSPYGRAYDDNSLGNLFRDLCDEIVLEDGSQPLRGLSLHGLRASAAEWWADTWDCGERDLMDIFGWESPKMRASLSAPHARRPRCRPTCSARR